MKLILNFLILVGVFSSSIAQKTKDYPPPKDSYVENKAAFLRSGTYPQNPLLWDYDVVYYELDVKVDPTVNFIDGSVRVLALVATSELNTFVLELLDNMAVDSVIIQGQYPDFVHMENEVLVDLPRPYQLGELIDIELFYNGEPQGEGFFSGFSVDVTPYDKPVLWTLSEPLNARQWWPVKQVLEDKADSVSVKITVPSPNIGASNGLLIETTELGDNLIQYHWKSNYPIAYYLISLAVSQYAEYNFFAPLSADDQQVFVQNFIYDDPDYFDEQKENIDLTADFISLFSDLFGDYPFAGEKYGHATAPLGGGMEHQTLSTMTGFSANLVSHELAHQWFGNLVTCETWSDIWINEGFASYGEYLAREFIFGIQQANEWMANSHDIIISEPGGSVYVPPLETTDVWRIFSGRLSYKKGAAILHMLRYEINDDPLFFDILQSFLLQFKNSVATGEDFKMVVEQLTGASWQTFFQQWYYGEGYPVFLINWWKDDNQLFIRSQQSGSTDNPDFFFTSIDFLVHTPQEDVAVRVVQDQPEQVFTFTIEEPVDSITFDPNNWLLEEANISPLGIDLGFKPVVFPNPFTGSFSIINPYFSGEESYYVYDLNGKLIAEGEIEGYQTHVSVNTPSRGILILEIRSQYYSPWRTPIMQLP